jgi:hypothetical protein
MMRHPRHEWVNRIPILLGEAGIGKTTVLRKMADHLVARTRESWRAMLIHAATQGMEDNTGLPILKKVNGRDVAGWAAPEHIPGAVPWTDDDGKLRGWTLGIIDELPTAPLLIQDQIRQLIDGTLPGSSTPVDPRCVYVATGNPPDPRYVTVNAMDEALEKRLKVYVVIPTTEELLQVWSTIMPDLIYKFLVMNTSAITELSPREWEGVSKDVQYLIEAGSSVQEAIGEAEDELADKADVLTTLRKFVEFGDDPYHYPIRGTTILEAEEPVLKDCIKLMKRWVTDSKDGLLGASSNDLLRALKITPATKLKDSKTAEDNIVVVLEFLISAQRPDMVKSLLEAVYETPLVRVVSSRMRKSKHLKEMDASVKQAQAFRSKIGAAAGS